LTGRSHKKKQKHFHLTEAYDTLLLARACFRSGEIRVLDSTGTVSGWLERLG